MCKSRKLCSADKSWKSLDAASLNTLYESVGSGKCLTSNDLESYPSSEALALPPPAKFSRRKLQLDMETNDAGASTPSKTLSTSSSDTMLSFPSAEDDFADSLVLQEFFCDADNASQPISPKKAARRKLQREANFALGLQNEAERRRQAGPK
jgi:hypothetical protein